MQDVESANLIVQIGLLIFTAASAVAAIVSARKASSARDEGETARNELLKLIAESSARTASATERATVAALSSVRPPRVEWTIRPAKGSLYEAINTGEVAIADAVVMGAGEVARLIRPRQDGPRTVEPGDSLAFIATKAWGPTTMVRIEFTNPITGKSDAIERAIR